ncbi:MAG: LysM peptidoglycan-binding domain-containing protein [Parcubacteria group bacterium]|nr:LysM peptidoglycan-binding domain-containing protein [Parcubacteria group bacterium]
MKKLVSGLTSLFVFTLVLASLAIAGDKVVYTVKNGDTLGELMYVWRVQGVEIEKLYGWNPGLGTQIKVGQEIVYYLPDRPDQQDVKKMSEQEVKKIVAETIARIATVKAEPAVAKTSVSTTAMIVGFIVMALILSAFILSLKRRRRRSEILIAEMAEAEKARAIAEAEAKVRAETALEIKWVEAADMGEIIYLVRVIKKSDGRWHAPFTFRAHDGVSLPLSRVDFNKITKEVRKCMKNPLCAEQFKRLLDAGQDVRRKCADVS